MENSRLQQILRNTSIAYAYHQIVTNQFGKPVDYIFLEANNYFEKYSGLEIEKIINKKVTEVIPNIKNDIFNWIEYYGELAQKQEHKTIEQFSEVLGRWFEIEAFSDKPGFFFTLIKDISDKKWEVQLNEELFNISKMLFELDRQEIPFQKINDFVCKLTGAQYGVFNVYADDGKTFTNKALSGINMDWFAVEKFLGFSVKNQTWDISERRVFEIKGGKAIRINNLTELAQDKIPAFVSNLISKTFNLGPVFIQEIADKGKTLGDFILLFKKGFELKNETTLATFANMIGVAMNRKAALNKLEIQHQQATEANKFHNLVLETIQEGLNILAPDLTILKSNHKMRLFQPDLNNAEGQKCHKIFFQNSIPCKICPITKSLKSGKAEQELIDVEISGSKKYFELLAYPMVNSENGQIDAVVELVRDVTEKEIAKKKLQMSDENLKNFFHSNIDFLWVLDENGNIIEINETVTKRLGFEAHELVGQSVLMVHPPGKRIETQQIVLEMLDGKRSICPVPLITRSGEEISVETYIFKGRWNEKEVLFGVSKDITALKFSEEKFAAAFRNNPAIAGLSDVETGKYMDVNDAFVEKIGYTRDEVIGKTASNVFRLDNDFRKKTIQELVEKGFVRNIETVLPSKSGKNIHVLLSAELLKIHGKLLNYTTAIDISERVNSEKALVKQNDRLKSLILENDNLNEELRIAVAKAEESDRLKSAFLANMSHEIRTPMNSIIGFSNFLIDDEISDDERIKYASIIMKNGNHLLHLINNIIDISKIEAGETKVSLSLTPINQILKDIHELFVTQIISNDKTDIELRLNIPSEPLVLMTDETRFRQIFINLIGNALKFTHQGFIEFGYEKKGHEIIFMVRDSGIGVEPDKQQEIFERFKQASEKIEKQYGGTGLGLSIVKSCVEMLGGKIWLESKLNEGTTFYFTLPE